jgi:lysophospholipase L1-like esterase
MKPLSAASGLLLIAMFCFSGSVAAREDRDDVALALGDSIAFGFMPQAGYEYSNADNFIGFPEYVARLLRLRIVNASCPGETTSGFLSATGDDNGCRAFRANFPLHVAYASTQLRFATRYLRRHHDVRVVTITLGSNDVLRLQAGCAADPDPVLCLQTGLPTLLGTIAANMQTILGDVRATGYRGPIVVTNYYSLDYSDPVVTGIIAGLNQAVEAPALAHGAVVADLFTAFQTAASNSIFAGNTCTTGLLKANPRDQYLCDVHPSQSGHQLIARAVARAYARSRSN